jgi:hypothetical protein
MSTKTLPAVVIWGPWETDWEQRDVDASLEGLQALVGGYIERVPMAPAVPGVNVWVNEDGLSLGLSVTARWVYAGRPAGTLVGPVVITFGGKHGRTAARLAKVRQAILPVIERLS